MKNYQGQSLKVELMEKNILINAMIVMMMLLAVAVGATAAGYMLLKVI